MAITIKNNRFCGLRTKKSVYTNYKLWGRKMGKTVSPRVDFFYFEHLKNKIILKKQNMLYILVSFILFKVTIKAFFY